MALTSFEFLIMVAVAALIYYIVPLKYRWLVLLAANGYFIFKADSLMEIGIFCFSALIAYLTALLIKRAKEKEKQGKAVLLAGIILTAGAMIFLKDAGFFHLKSVGLAPIGISYYSLTWIGYMLDVYWGTCEAETNFLKFMTFAGYFPGLTSGPIQRFKNVEPQLIEGKRFDSKNLYSGAERILWGFMEKLVISDRLAVYVDKVFDAPYTYSGFYIWIAYIFFVLQLYTDFAGCIDIALGVSEIFGITLPENFNLPFMAQTLAEFWRRFHMTLGDWLKDYILYPILTSRPWQKLGKLTKNKFGKKTGRKITSWCGLAISWFIIGFWHGGRWNYIFGVGILFGSVIILSEMLEPAFDRLNKFLHINTEAFSWKAFRVVRTWFIYMVGLSFFRADSLKTGFSNWGFALKVFNPWILFDGSLYEVGLTVSDYHILFVFLTVLVASGIIKAVKKCSLREIINRQNLVFRWILILLLLYAVIIYGCYGEGFSSASFIYQKF